MSDLEPLQTSVEIRQPRCSNFRGKAIVGIATGSCWLIAFAAWFTFQKRPIAEQVDRNLTPFGRFYTKPDYDLPIYLLAGLAAVAMATLFTLWTRSTSCPETIPKSVPERSSRRYTALDLISILIIAALVCVVAPRELMERSFSVEEFHHLNFYLMGPLQAFRHGRILGDHSYCQYGSGWVLVYALLDSVWRADYLFFFGTMPLFGMIYFQSVYLVLRRLIADRVWALLGVFICIQMQVYSETNVPLWAFPSSTVLRCPFDMLLTWTLLQTSTNRSRNAWYGAATGFLGGLALLFGTDTGIYVIAGLAIASMLILLDTAKSHTAHGIFQLLSIWTVCVVSFLCGMAIVSRGRLIHLTFWSGYYESLIIYPFGFSSLPLGEVITNPTLAIMLMVVLMTYSLTLGRVFARAILGETDARDRGLAFLAVVGFGTLILFINRSHQSNFYHPIVPACVLLSTTLATTFPEAITSRITWRRLFTSRPISILGCGLLMLVILRNPNFWDNPTVIPVLCGTKAPPSRIRFDDVVNTIQTIGQTVKENTHPNSLAVIGTDPTIWLVVLDLPPSGRYCPTLPITTSQVQLIQNEIRSTDASTIIVARRPPMHYDLDLIEKMVAERFELRHADFWAALYTNPSKTNRPEAEN